MLKDKYTTARLKTNDVTGKETKKVEISEDAYSIVDGLDLVAKALGRKK